MVVESEADQVEGFGSIRIKIRGLYGIGVEFWWQTGVLILELTTQRPEANVFAQLEAEFYLG